MKKITQKPKLIKVRNKLNPDEIYWSLPGETKDIDGITFIPVIKNMGIRDTTFWMRKDSMEIVK